MNYNFFLSGSLILLEKPRASKYQHSGLLCLNIDEEEKPNAIKISWSVCLQLFFLASPMIASKAKSPPIDENTNILAYLVTTIERKPQYHEHSVKISWSVCYFSSG